MGVLSLCQSIHHVFVKAFTLQFYHLFFVDTRPYLSVIPNLTRKNDAKSYLNVFKRWNEVILSLPGSLLLNMRATVLTCTKFLSVRVLCPSTMTTWGTCWRKWSSGSFTCPISFLQTARTSWGGWSRWTPPNDSRSDFWRFHLIPSLFKPC